MDVTMKFMISTSILISTALLVGCQTTQMPTQAQSEADTLNRKFMQADKEATDCSKPIMSSQAAQIVAQQVIFLSKENTNQSMLLSTQSKLSVQQKMALKDYLTQNLKCREAFFRGIEGTPYYGVFFKYFSTMDNVYVQLMSDNMTVAQANRIKVQAIEDNMRDLAASQAALK